MLLWPVLVLAVTEQMAGAEISFAAVGLEVVALEKPVLALAALVALSELAALVASPELALGAWEGLALAVLEELAPAAVEELVPMVSEVQPAAAVSELTLAVLADHVDEKKLGLGAGKDPRAAVVVAAAASEEARAALVAATMAFAASEAQSASAVGRGHCVAFAVASSFAFAVGLVAPTAVVALEEHFLAILWLSRYVRVSECLLVASVECIGAPALWPVRQLPVVEVAMMALAVTAPQATACLAAAAAVARVTTLPTVAKLP